MNKMITMMLTFFVTDGSGNCKMSLFMFEDVNKEDTLVLVLL